MQQYGSNIIAPESRASACVVASANVPSLPTKRRYRIYRGLASALRPVLTACFALWNAVTAIPLKVAILCLLVFQNCAAVAFLRFTRTRDDIPIIPITTVVALQEGTKFVLSMLWSFSEFVYFSSASYEPSHGNCMKAADASEVDDEVHSGKGVGTHHDEHPEAIGDKVFDDDHSATIRVCSTGQETFSERLLRDWLKGKLLQSSGWLMCIPAALFTIQNCLLFVALENLEPTLFQVTYQSRLLVAAVMMKVFLHRMFSFQKWVAMGLLICGIVLTQSTSSSHGVGAAGKAADAIAAEETAVGLLAVLVCCVSSSAAGVAMEKMFKDGTAIALSTRNVHLSLFSIAFALLSKVASAWWKGGPDDVAVRNVGDTGGSVFEGVDTVVAMMILNQAAGGVLVALVLKYADNVLKSFATTIAIVVSGVTSHFLFGFEPTAMFTIGATIVIIATLVYGSPDRC